MLRDIQTLYYILQCTQILRICYAFSIIKQPAPGLSQHNVFMPGPLFGKQNSLLHSLRLSRQCCCCEQIILCNQRSIQMFRWNPLSLRGCLFTNCLYVWLCYVSVCVCLCLHVSFKPIKIRIEQTLNNSVVVVVCTAH